MKKVQFSYLLIAFTLTTLLFACIKGEVKPKEEPEIENQKRNEATWITNHDGSKGWLAFLKIMVGHTYEQCGGTCVKLFWEWTHIDCRGFGSVCESLKKAQIVEGDTPGEYMIIFIDSDALGEDLEYPFPDRSLYITNPVNNNELWMNIPEQITIRGDVNEPFTLYDMWFSEEQELENL
ncbi:MAG: hypothetical protein LBI45_09075 [Bacteroidales bacterium]|jgi:hypothetical protein|nr:hypothetical protein [Bacteroidales bacterium]